MLLALLIVGSWSAWAVQAYRAHVRTVTMADLRSDLSDGIVRSYDGLTEFRRERAWPPQDRDSLATAPMPEPGAPTADARVVTVVYYVDAWVAPIRILSIAPPNGSEVVDVLEVRQELDAAGVPSREQAPDRGPVTNPAESAQVSGLVTGLLALVGLFVIRPTRGTRWFWFWLFGAPLGLGVLAWVVLEGFHLRRHSRSGEPAREGRRLPGLFGFLMQGGAKFLIPF